MARQRTSGAVGRNDGPWGEPDDLRKVTYGILRYSRGDTRNGFSIIGLGPDYSGNHRLGTLNAPDPISWRNPVRGPFESSSDRRTSIELAGIPTGGGRTYRHGTADSLRSNGENSTRHRSSRVTD